MRGLPRDKYVMTVLMLLVLLFFTITVPHLVTAQEEQLYIDTDVNEIEEGKEFLVYVYILNETEFPVYQTDVEISFNDQQYQITDSGEYPGVSIRAPSVNEDTEYNITAVKQGYESAEDKITVLNKLPTLVVTPDEFTIDAGKSFSVLITDSESGDGVEGASVYIENVYDTGITTKSNGRVSLVAPDEYESIRIIAQKEGYQDGYESVWINIQPSIWSELQENPNTFIAIAAILLISAIIYVTLRQRKGIDSRAKEISKEETLKNYGISENVTLSTSDENKPSEQSSLQGDVRIQPQRESKVEEIRISKPRKEKTIISADDQKDEEKADSRKKTIDPEDKWFEGTDDIRYEIDKLTGEIDEEGKDKWFEGIDDIREKIDEKIRKKDKKKEESNGEGK